MARGYVLIISILVICKAKKNPKLQGGLKFGICIVTYDLLVFCDSS